MRLKRLDTAHVVMPDEATMNSCIRLLALALSAVLPACAADSGAAAAPGPAAMANATAQLIGDCLTQLATKQSATNHPYYEAGEWHAANEKNWPSRVGPASAAAALWRRGQQAHEAPAARQQWWSWAVETFDRAIRDHRNPDGSMGDKLSPESMFFGIELASAYLDLEPALDAPTRERWRTTLVGIVAYLQASGNLDNGKRNWYTNGNIELDELLLLHLVSQVTHADIYPAMIATQWDFTITPPQGRWKGFGLIYTRQPTRADGTDGAAYLAESGGKEPGFDPDYTMFQADIASRLYLRTGEARYLRLVNLFMNQLMPQVDKKTWIIDATSGSRRKHRMPFFTCGLATAAWHGGQNEWTNLVPEQFKVIANEYRGGARQGWFSPAMYRGLATDLSVLMSLGDAAGATNAPAAQH